jgi:integrase
LARSWFARLKSQEQGRANGGAVTIAEAAKSFIRDIRAGNPAKTAAKQKYHQTKWNVISDFFTKRALDVDAVTTPVLKEFMRWRSDVKPITLAKDFVTIRLTLRHAVEEGWIASIPVFPRVGKLDANPRPWLTPEQWALVQEQAEERVEIARDEAGWHRQSRMDLLDFMRLQVATCMRVDELRSIRVRDVKVRTKKHGPPLEFDYRTRKITDSPTEYLEIEINKGKRNWRTVVTRVAYSGVETLRALVKRKDLKPGDLLFDEHHGDAFRELLLDSKVNLRENEGINPNLKALRCTGIMLWVLAEPNANLKLLADNFGTSVAMLDQFYLKPLNVKMNREVLVG